MKELSIEEKAKAYDEAKARMSIAYNSNRCTIGFMNEIFPEPKESEDERIRKTLINGFNKLNKSAVWYNGVTNGQILAWFEKQGEPIDRIVKRATTEKQRVLLTETNGNANIDWDTRSLQDVKVLLEYGLDYIKKLEK